MSKKERRKGHIIRGARRIAAYVFGDEEQFRSIYPIADELGLFWLGGMLAANTLLLDQRLREKESKGRTDAA
jgi:hypothetical protein